MAASPKQPRLKDLKHLAVVRLLPCFACWLPSQWEDKSQAAHVASESYSGMAYKAGDDCTVPLCPVCHVKQHAIGEAKFWHDVGYEVVYVLSVAHAIHAADKNEFQMLMILERMR